MTDDNPIMGIKTKACVNGVYPDTIPTINQNISNIQNDVEDVEENISNIQDDVGNLDERVTALEQGGSSTTQNLTIVPFNEISSLFEETSIEIFGEEHTVYKVKNDLKILIDVDIFDTLPATYDNIELGTHYYDIITIPKGGIYYNLTNFPIGKSVIGTGYQVDSSNNTVLYSLVEFGIKGLIITNESDIVISFNSSGIVNDKRTNTSIIDSFVKTTNEISVNYLTSLEGVGTGFSNDIGIAFVR